MAAEKVNRLDILESNLKQLIKLRPDHAHAYNALGYTFADRNERLPEAHVLAAHALGYGPSPDARGILAALGAAVKELQENVEDRRVRVTRRGNAIEVEISTDLLFGSGSASSR